MINKNLEKNSISNFISFSLLGISSNWFEFNGSMQRLITGIIAIILLVSACDIGVDRSELSTSNFNTTFSGEIITTQAEQDFVDDINLNIRVGSSLNGTFFRKSDGAVGIIYGDATDVSATFNGSINSDCSASFNGSLKLVGDNTLLLEMEGSDCDGQFESFGMLTKLPCTDIAGTYNVKETATITCTIGGETETISESGQATIFLEQNGCHVSFNVPGVTVIREGELIGNTLILSGPFVIPLGNEVSLTKNQFTATVTLDDEHNDEYNFTFKGSGIAEGTVDGISFLCTGNSTGTLERCFDVAVAVLRGGLVGDFVVDSDLDMIKNQAIRVDPKRVIARGFKAGPSQLTRVGQWLNKITRNGDCSTNVILVGHSLGGDAVRRSNFSNICSRITIDPINPDLLPIFNQRSYTYSPVSTAGRFLNVLASTTEDLNGVPGRGLLGHRISGAIEWIESETNHFTVVPRVLVSGLVSEEVQGCLSNGASQAGTLNSVQHFWFHQPPLKGKQPFYFSFGWRQIDSDSDFLR